MTRILICTYSARTLASESFADDRIGQKMYEDMGPTETVAAATYTSPTTSEENCTLEDATAGDWRAYCLIQQTPDHEH